MRILLTSWTPGVYPVFYRSAKFLLQTFPGNAFISLLPKNLNFRDRIPRITDSTAKHHATPVPFTRLYWFSFHRRKPPTTSTRKRWNPLLSLWHGYDPKIRTSCSGPECMVQPDTRNGSTGPVDLILQKVGQCGEKLL